MDLLAQLFAALFSVWPFAETPPEPMPCVEYVWESQGWGKPTTKEFKCVMGNHDGIVGVLHLCHSELKEMSPFYKEYLEIKDEVESWAHIPESEKTGRWRYERNYQVKMWLKEDIEKSIKRLSKVRDICDRVFNR